MTRSTSSAPGAATTSGRARRRCCRRWSTSGSAAAIRRRRGSGGSPPTPRELHEEYAVQRWPETKRLLGLLVNSSGRAHGRNARRLVHSARKQDRRLAVALLAGAVSHTPEGEEVLRGARMRMARKPSAIARELLRNFPKGGKRGKASARQEAAEEERRGSGRKNRARRRRTPMAPARAQRRSPTSPAPRLTRPPPVTTTTGCRGRRSRRRLLSRPPS